MLTFYMFQSPSSSNHASDSVIDIDYYSMQQDDPVVAGSGSGSKIDDDATDDEDLMTSGSGSGYNIYPHVDKAKTTMTTTTTTTTRKPLTPCEQLRKASTNLIGNYIPRCTKEGYYDTMQCRGYPGTGNCWCSDRDGRMIPSTNMENPNVPDCELGTNLKPCVFEIIKFSRKQLLGSYRPNCTLEGYFQAVQCHGSRCYCVTQYGKKIEGTEVFINDRPNCEETTTKLLNFRTTMATRTTSQKSEIVVEELLPTEKTNHVLNAEEPDKPEPKPDYTIAPGTDDEPEKPLNELEGNDSEANYMKPASQSTHIMTQPGLLAAIIGGAVVALLCAILLIMFVVYRMRKKDEGSYALDEPRKMPNYAYQRAENNKEFYA
ncbi:hypothetical protein SNE40_005953 [Patella caerulea]|uniref:Syndecan n=1 Tax=Patella caerulea TaxID=87958 RepID=A0AAN8K1L8_PATCE